MYPATKAYFLPYYSNNDLLAAEIWKLCSRLNSVLVTKGQKASLHFTAQLYVCKGYYYFRNNASKGILLLVTFIIHADIFFFTEHRNFSMFSHISTTLKFYSQHILQELLVWIYYCHRILIKES